MTASDFPLLPANSSGTGRAKRVFNEGISGWRSKGRVFVLLCLLFGPFVVVHIQEMIFRRRAERLLADMRPLILRKAKMAEIQDVFKRWDPHACSEQSCMIEGDSWRSDFSVNQIVDPEETTTDWHKLWLPPLFRT